MGKVVGRTASAARIKEAATKTLIAAKARGGEVASLAENRLAEPVAALEANETQLAQARAEDEAAHAALIARDDESDLEIGTVCDEMWNAMGRPAQSIDYDLIVSGGKRMWTDGDPARQPHLMIVLASNIRGTKHPRLVERKEEWASRIEKRAAVQVEAANAAAPAYAKAISLAMQRRTLAEITQLGLTRLKRDLKNLGMSEVQIHEIIPEAPAPGVGNNTSHGPNPPAPVPV